MPNEATPDVNSEIVKALQALTAKPGEDSRGAVDLTATFKVGDKDVSILDLIRGYEKSGSASEELEQLRTQNERFVSLLNPSLPVDRRREVLVEYFMAAGADRAAAEAEASAELERAFPTDSGGEENDEEGNDNVDQRDELIEKLTSRLEALENRNKESLRSTSVERLEQAINNSLDSNEQFGRLFKKLGKMHGSEEEVKAAEEAIQTFRDSTVLPSIKRRAQEILNEQYRNVGEFKPEWIPDAVQRAVDAEATTQKAAIGVFDQLGKAPETVPAELRQLREKPPVEAPTAEQLNEMSVADVNKAVEAYIADGLGRAELEAHEAISGDRQL